MSALLVLRIGLVVWVIWHAAFGILSTFFPEVGADIVGWSPGPGWSDALLAMSKQYGMVMLLLAGVYFIMLLDPARYINFLWVAVAEQLLGIGYGAYIYTMIGQLTATQLTLQAVGNLAIIGAIVILWTRLRQPQTPVPA
ncbi:MAG: hypothetical protein AAGF45_05850 [Pseudomonadota bacterium]